MIWTDCIDRGESSLERSETPEMQKKKKGKSRDTSNTGHKTQNEDTKNTIQKKEDYELHRPHIKRN